MFTFILLLVRSIFAKSENGESSGQTGRVVSNDGADDCDPQSVNVLTKDAMLTNESKDSGIINVSAVLSRHDNPIDVNDKHPNDSAIAKVFSVALKFALKCICRHAFHFV